MSHDPLIRKMYGGSRAAARFRKIRAFSDEVDQKVRDAEKAAKEEQGRLAILAAMAADRAMPRRPI